MRDSSQFNPQIAALAMPDGSEVSAVANGITNIGKVFVDAEAQQSASALNALKMEEANQSIIAKKNENSVFGEEQSRKKETHLLEKRNKTLEGLKKEIEWKADVKKQTDNGFMEKFEALLPEDMFNGDNGKFTEEKAKVIGDAFSQSNGWWKDNMHLYNAVVDKRRKSALDMSKTNSEIASKEATTAGTLIENQYKPAKFKADILQSNASATSSYSTAAKNKVETQLLPQKMALDARKETRLEKSDTDQAKILARMKETKGEDFGQSIPGYQSLSDDDKSAFKDHYNNFGVKPTVMVKKAGFWGDDEYSLRYQSSSDPVSTKSASIPKVKPNAPSAQKKSLFQQSLDAGK